MSIEEKANSLFNKMLFKDVIALVSTAKAAPPMSIMLMAKSHEKLCQFAMAAYTFQKYLECANPTPLKEDEKRSLYDTIGNLFVKIKLYRTAIRWFSKILELKPQNPKPFTDKITDIVKKMNELSRTSEHVESNKAYVKQLQSANSLFQKKDYGNACDLFQKATELVDDFEGKVNYGECLLSIKQFAHSAFVLEDALECKNKRSKETKEINEILYFNLGKALEELKEYAASLKYYKIGIDYSTSPSNKSVFQRSIEAVKQAKAKVEGKILINIWVLYMEKAFNCQIGDFAAPADKLEKCKIDLIKLVSQEMLKKIKNYDSTKAVVELWKWRGNPYELSSVLDRMARIYSLATTANDIDAEQLSNNYQFKESDYGKEFIAEIITNGLPGKIKMSSKVLKIIEQERPIESEQLTEEIKTTISSMLYLNKPITEIIKKGQKGGCMGLENIGNTCYMNAALQCLNHCSDLSKYILGGYYKYELNPSNVMGSFAWIATAYIKLILTMWQGADKCTSPQLFKSEISKKFTQFKGFNQQDSHEFLQLFLDVMNEDLSRIKGEKVYIEEKDKKAPDEELSKESWHNFKMRNDSIITDLFYGQLKSTIKCPKCKGTFLKFDSYNSLTLSIPVTEKVNFSILPTQLGGLIQMSSKIDPGLSLSGLLDTANISQDKRDKFYVPLLMDSTSTILKLTDKVKTVINDRRNLYFAGITEQFDGITNSLFCLKLGLLSDNFFGNSIQFSNISKILCIKKSTNIKALKIEIAKYIEALCTHLKADIPGYTLYAYNTNNTYASEPKADCEFCHKYHKDHCPFKVDDAITVANIKSFNKGLFTFIVKFNNGYKHWSKIKDYNNTQFASSSCMEGKTSIYDCFNSFSTEDILDDENKFYCSSCKAHQNASKKMQIYKPPLNLIIHFKRFKHTARSNVDYYFSIPYIKNTELISYPLKGLDITPYVVNAQRPYVYDLYAVVCHKGSMSGGHYIAKCYSEYMDKWVECDDESVQLITDKSIVGTDSYVVFYRMRDK